MNLFCCELLFSDDNLICFFCLQWCPLSLCFMLFIHPFFCCCTLEINQMTKPYKTIYKSRYWTFTRLYYVKRQTVATTAKYTHSKCYASFNKKRAMKNVLSPCMKVSRFMWRTQSNQIDSRTRWKIKLARERERKEKAIIFNANKDKRKGGAN